MKSVPDKKSFKTILIDKAKVAHKSIKEELPFLVRLISIAVSQIALFLVILLVFSNWIRDFNQDPTIIEIILICVLSMLFYRIANFFIDVFKELFQERKGD